MGGSERVVERGDISLHNPNGEYGRAWEYHQYNKKEDDVEFRFDALENKRLRVCSRRSTRIGHVAEAPIS